MAKLPKPSEFDLNKRAREQLQQTIITELEAERSGDETTLPVDEVRFQGPTVKYDADRDKARVLFVTNDTSFLNPVDESLERFFKLTSEFDEIHIMVLRSGVIPTKPVLRVRNRIWLYVVSAEYWWWTPVIANEEMAINQLTFANGFRPDLIVALEPFEAGIAAQWIGKAQKCPVQIHVRRNFQTEAWRKESPRNKWRAWMARYVLRRASSVRYQTKQIKDTIAPLCNKNATLELLPRFNNFANIINHAPEFDVHEKYPMYNKIFLYIGALNYDSRLFGAIDVLKYVLANPRVGLIVIGDGPARADCERKLKNLGLQTQVVFAQKVNDISTYLKTADALFVSDTTAAADEIVLQSAVASLPAIMLETDLRLEYFTDTQNAFLCNADLSCFKEKLFTILHNDDIREEMRTQLIRTVLPRLAEDAQQYLVRYRESVERMIIDVES